MRITPRRVERAIAFIEAHLNEPLTPSDVAEATGVSRFALHRLFRASVGESLQRYILKRKLTEAARALADSNRQILRLALESGFGSQEAFTRAFQAQFGVTPGRYRRAPSSRRRPGLYRPSPQALAHRNAGVSHQPTIVTRAVPLIVQGWGTAADFEDETPIGALWDKVLEALEGDPVELIGVAQESHAEIPLSGAQCIAYVAGVERPNWPERATPPIDVTVPPGAYAVFDHHGPLERIVDTVTYAWASWLPQCDYLKSTRPDLEIVHSSQFGLANAHLELWLAIDDATIG